jgi:hypothetical protein
MRSLGSDDPRVHEQGGLAFPAPSARPVPALRPGLGPPPAPPRTTDPRGPTRRDSRAFNPSDARPGLARPASSGRRRARPRGGRLTCDAHEATGHRDRLVPFPGSARGRPACGDRGRGDPPARLVPRDRGAALDVSAQLRKYTDRCPRLHPGERPPGRDRSRPGLPGRAPPPARPRGGRRRGASRRSAGTEKGGGVKIGLVSAVRLPAPGRGDPARRLPVREPPAARPRRPDPDARRTASARVRGRRHPDREGLLDAGQRLGRARSPSRRGSSPRSGTLLEREQFDLLHFHEPFVPFLSPIILRSRRA